MKYCLRTVSQNILLEGLNQFHGASFSIILLLIVFYLFLSPRFFFKKKRRGYCNRLRPSVCPLCYLLLNQWTKFNQIWFASYSHESACTVKLFVLPPWALGRGQKVKYHLISITKSISKICVPNFVVFSQLKDTKHIRWDFHFVA